MRASVASLSKKFISTFFAATLALGLVPAAAFAAPEGATIAANETTAEDSSIQDIATAEGPEAPVVDIEAPDGGMETPDIISSEVALDASGNAASTEDPQDTNDVAILAAMERINEDVALTQPVAQQESTRSYFLAQTLESTKTVPIVSANLPLYVPEKAEATDAVTEGAGEGDSASSERGGEDSDESDLPVSNVIAADSTVIGSFEYRGVVYAVEPGGETVAAVASDYAKLPEKYIEEHTIVLPSVVTADYIDYYSVTRIADYAFASLTSEVASNHVISSEVGEADAVEKSALIEQNEGEALTDSTEDAEDEGPSTNEGITILGIPSSVTSIGDDAFSGFDTLQYIVVEDGNPTYASYDGALYSADLTNLRLIPEGRVGTVRVAPSATAVEPEAFSHCPSVDTVVADPESEVYLALVDILVDYSVALNAASVDTLEVIDPALSLGDLSQKGLFDELMGDVVLGARTLNMSASSGFPVGVNQPTTICYTPPQETLEKALLADLSQTTTWMGSSTSYAYLGMNYSAVGILQGRLILKSVGAGGQETYWGCAGSETLQYCTLARYFPDGSPGLEMELDAREGYGPNVIEAANTCLHGLASGIIFYGMAAGDSPLIKTFRTFSFDPNGGTYKGSPKPTIVKGEVYITVPAGKDAPVRDGYDFNGWAVSGGPFAKEVKNTDGFVVDGTLRTVSDLTFTAQWKKTTHTITFDIATEVEGTNTGTTSICEWYGLGWYEDVTVEKTMPAIIVPTCPGYKFKGYSEKKYSRTAEYWQTDTLTSSTVANPEATTFTRDITLYAVWEQAVFTITLDQGGGSGGTTAIYEWHGMGWYPRIGAASTTDRIIAPKLTGYKFKGYSKTQGARTAEYWTADTLTNSEVTGNPANTTFTEDVVLHPVWEQAVITITLDQGSGSEGTTAIYEWHGRGWYPYIGAVTTTDHIIAPKLTGYKFKGYSKTQGVRTAEYWTADTLTNSEVTGNPANTTFTEDAVLYAVWEQAVFSITLNPGSGSGGTTVMHEWHGMGWYPYIGATSTKDSITAPTWEGHRFLGYSETTGATTADYWKTDTNTSSNVTNPGNMTFTSSKTLYAVWGLDKYTIEWNMKGHGLDQEPTTTEYIFSGSFALPKLSDDEGWEFGGWFTDDGCTTPAKDIDSSTTGNKVFYAKWDPAWYDITYEMSGHGMAPTSPTQYDYGKNTPLPNPDKVEGWTFGGWYWNEATTQGQEASITATTIGDITVYAKWTRNSHTVSWIYDGGDGGTDGDETVPFDYPVRLKAPGKRAGYDFTGWKVEVAGSSDAPSVLPEDYELIMPDTNVKCTAQWSTLDYITVNLSDPYLSEATAQGAVYYWPQKGYVNAPTSTAVVKEDEHIKDAPNLTELTKLGYKFLGWFDDVNENKGATQMIDANGAIKTQIVLTKPAEGEAIVWYAHWERTSCPVDLAAAYAPNEGEDAFAVTTPGTESIPYARFGVPLSESVEGAKIEIPKRTGYTFLGYYALKYPEVSVADAEDGGFTEAVQWIDRNGNVLDAMDWSERPADKRGRVTLYAAWRLDECDVTFDATGNVNGVEQDKEQVVLVNAPSRTKWSYGKAKTGIPKPGETTFYRTGYDFGGWYFLKDAAAQDIESNRQFVTDTQGNAKPETWTPENWDAVKGGITLYPAWTPKTYTLKFDANKYSVGGPDSDEENVTILTRKYDQPLDLSDYEPSYLFYVFENWYAKATDQLFEGAHMTANADGTKRFTPRGMVAQTNPIEVYARWMEPGKSSYTLYVGTPGGTELVSETQHEYKWTEIIVFNGTEAPALVENYRFVGWVWVESDDAARKMIAAGGPKDTDETWSGFGPNQTKNHHFVAKWAPVKLSLTLQSTQPDDDSAWLVSTDILENYGGQTPEGVKSWEETCESLNEERFDLARFLHYDTTQDAFVLPDVVRKGQTFLGWKLKGSPEPARRGIVVRPDTQDNAEMRDLVYVPVFKDAIYKIVLDGQGIGETKEYPNIAYSESFTFPYPATLNTGSVFACWSSKPDTNSNAAKAFFPLGEPTPLAPIYDETGNVKEDGFGLAQIAEVDEDGNNVIRVYAVWNSDYHVDVPLFANLAIDTERGDVIAGVNTISPDDRNKDADATYRIESIRYEPLKNKEGEDGKYAFEGAEDKVYLSVYAGLNTGDATDTEHLLYAENIDRDGGADGEVTYTDANGDTAKAKPLLIELGGESTVLYGRTAPAGQASLENVTDADAPYGFVTFSASNPLTIRYGLYFESDQTRKDFAFGSSKYAWLLPENDATNKVESIDPGDANFGRRNAWSGNTVDIAKLHYTVSLVSETK